MEYVVLDTDVASLSFRQRLPTEFNRLLVGRTPCVTFVTIGEMTKWAEIRDWSPRNRQQLDHWLDRQAHLEYDIASQRGSRPPRLVLHAEVQDYHQQYLHKNPGGYCNIGPNGLSCPIGIARTDA